MEQIDYVNTLASETLIQIFSYFESEELCILSCVCTRWRDVSRDPVLWKTLRLRSMYLKHPTLYSDLLERCEKITKLNVGQGKGFDNFWQSIPKIPTLKELYIWWNNRLNEQHMKIILTKCLFIHTLDFENCPSIDIKFVAHLPSLQHLQKLSLRRCLNVDDECIGAIAKGCKKLEYLDLDHISEFTDQAFVYIAQYMKTFLKGLYFSANFLSDHSIVAVSECKELVSLRIQHDMLLTENIFFYLSLLPNLRDLSLHVCLDKAATEQFFLNPNILKLEKLDFSAEIDDQSLFIITKSSWKELRELTIESSRLVTDKGLSAVVCSCKKLRSLTVKFMYNEELVGDFLYLIPSELPDLKNLNLILCTKIKESATRDLAAKMPNLKMEIELTLSLRVRQHIPGGDDGKVIVKTITKTYR